MPTLSAAIIGTGQIAGGFDQGRLPGERGIFSHAGAYRETGKFRLVTVADLDPARARAFQQQWGAERCVPDPMQVLDEFHDVVSVCAPDETHFGLVMALLRARCCRTIFVEKPPALTLREMDELCALASESGINVVVNYQRRFEPVHLDVAGEIRAAPQLLTTINAYYMKGLRHNGITMLDTLALLCGQPEGVLAYNRVHNGEIGEHSYEFVLYYGGWNATVKTVDPTPSQYNYHLFEIDLLFSGRRLTFIENSRSLRTAGVGPFAYAGVRTLLDAQAQTGPTGLDTSMTRAAEYVHGVTTGALGHSTNTPQSAYNNILVAERVEQSFDQGMTKLTIEPSEWKR